MGAGTRSKAWCRAYSCQAWTIEDEEWSFRGESQTSREKSATRQKCCPITDGKGKKARPKEVADDGTQAGVVPFRGARKGLARRDATCGCRPCDIGAAIKVGPYRKEVGDAARVQRWRHHRQGI